MVWWWAALILYRSPLTVNRLVEPRSCGSAQVSDRSAQGAGGYDGSRHGGERLQRHDHGGGKPSTLDL
eukprot:7902074-Pyramimonas_sp.AAC.1